MAKESESNDQAFLSKSKKALEQKKKTALSMALVEKRKRIVTIKILPQHGVLRREQLKLNEQACRWACKLFKMDLNLCSRAPVGAGRCKRNQA
jgi:hypothetical protein